MKKPLKVFKKKHRSALNPVKLKATLVSFVLTVKRLHKPPTSSVILDMPCWQHPFSPCGEAKINFKVERNLVYFLGLLWQCL